MHVCLVSVATTSFDLVVPTSGSLFDVTTAFPALHFGAYVQLRDMGSLTW